MLDHVESSPLHPDADPAFTVNFLMAREAHDEPVTDDVQQAVLEWEGREPVAVQVDAVTSAAQRRLLTAVPPLVDVLKEFSSPFADKVLAIDAEAEYNKNTAAFVKPNREKVSKDDLLARVCEGPVVTPSKQIPTRCVGPSAILNVVPATCEVTYLPANKTKVYRCQAARLVLVRNPAFCNKAYRSSASFRGPFCIVRKLLGNTTTLSLNGGTLRVDLAAAKDSLTRDVLSTLSDSLGTKEYDDTAEKEAGGNVLTSLLESVGEDVVRAAVGRALEKGISLASALLGKSL